MSHCKSALSATEHRGISALERVEIDVAGV